MKKVAKNPFKGMRRVFLSSTLSESVSWLYEIPIFRLDQALSDAFESINGQKVSFPYHVNYIIDNRINAAAWHSKSSGCAIAISSSTPLLLIMACMQFANLCDVRTALPITSDGMLLVHKNKVHLKTQLEREIRNEKQILAVLEAFSADGKMNNSMGLFLCELALKFIAMHECMHVILGHTRYLSNHYDLKSFIEFHNSRTIAPEFSRMLEFIADRHAIRGLWTRLAQKDIDDFYKLQLLPGISVDEDTYLLRCLVYAICILFHLFPGNSESIFAQGRSHPHPYIRARWMCNELAQDVDEIFPNKYEPLNAFTWAGAQLSCNFDLPGNWAKASKEDYNQKTKESFSDNSYSAVLAEAKKWQHLLMKSFGPLYPSIS